MFLHAVDVNEHRRCFSHPSLHKPDPSLYQHGGSSQIVLWTAHGYLFSLYTTVWWNKHNHCLSKQILTKSNNNKVVKREEKNVGLNSAEADTDQLAKTWLFAWISLQHSLKNGWKAQWPLMSAPGICLLAEGLQFLPVTVTNLAWHRADLQYPATLSTSPLTDWLGVIDLEQQNRHTCSIAWTPPPPSLWLHRLRKKWPTTTLLPQRKQGQGGEKKVKVAEVSRMHI